jgi:acyl carrier protein
VRTKQIMTPQDVIDLMIGLDLDIDKDALSNDATLESFGIDSLDLFSLLVEIESKTGKKILDDEVAQLTTINEIVNYFS